MDNTAILDHMDLMSEFQKLQGKGNEGLRFPFSEAPTPGTLKDVAPGVKWLRMPLPFALNHINLWVLDDGDGWTLVDTGINTDATRDLWTQIFAGPLKDKPVKRLIATHFHPDHIGLAGWLVENHRIPFWITQDEMEIARTAHGITKGIAGPATSRIYTEAGLGHAIADAQKAHGGGYRAKVYTLPETFIPIDTARPIAAGGTTWRVIVGEGHSPQMAALYSADLGVLISGDQILPGITPNVSVSSAQPTSNPLKKFLETLEHFRPLPQDTLVLPSHKLPFHGLHARIDQLIAHHHERLSVARDACAQGATAGEVLAALFKRTLDAHQLAFALGETVAHLNYLVDEGSVAREMTPEGVYRYSASPAAACDAAGRARKCGDGHTCSQS